MLDWMRQNQRIICLVSSKFTWYLKSVKHYLKLWQQFFMVKQDEKCYWEILEKNIFRVLEKEGFQLGLGNYRKSLLLKDLASGHLSLKSTKP